MIGFGGAFISLLMSKTMAKWSTGAQVITQPSSLTEVWLVDTVERLSRKAGLPMPEVAIYDGEPECLRNRCHQEQFAGCRVDWYLRRTA